MLSLLAIFSRHPHTPAEPIAPPWPPERRNALLENTCRALRLGYFAEAQEMLETDPHVAGDAASLNLLGVIHEVRHHWTEARRCYRRSIRADARYAPPRQNMRRIFELEMFGHSAQPVALGDERPALAMLLQAKEASRAEARRLRPADDVKSHPHARNS